MSSWVWSFEVAVRTLWQEARGESEDGQRAVAHAIQNRLKSGRWGHTFAEVCLAPFQFSGWLTHDPNRLAVAKLPDDDALLTKLRGILTAAANEQDPTGGATHYYADYIPPPAWSKTASYCGKFGHQLFYRDVK